MGAISVIRSTNLALRFALELCALGALGYWGYRTGARRVAKLTLGIGAPLVAALIWGTVVAPGAAVAVPRPVHLLLQVAFFGLAVAGLIAARRPSLARVLGVAALLNGVLMFIWAQ